MGVACDGATFESSLDDDLRAECTLPERECGERVMLGTLVADEVELSRPVNRRGRLRTAVVVVLLLLPPLLLVLLPSPLLSSSDVSLASSRAECPPVVEAVGRVRSTAASRTVAGAPSEVES